MPTENSTAPPPHPSVSPADLDALRSVSGRGDLWHVNPSTARSLASRGLLDVWGDTALAAAELTELGRHVLAEARRTGALA